MADSHGSIESLLSELIALQKHANLQQLRAAESAEKYQAETRQRVEASIRLQEIAVGRQKAFMRAWVAVLIVLLVAIAFLLYRIYH
jgi:hypothetical protein